MSGIAGIVNLDGAPVDRDLVWSDGNVGFRQQPFTLDGEVWLIADARIDGIGESSSEETILSAYGKFGDDCVEHLIGDFAFVIWDKRLRRLFCARDHFGVKPFFYAHVGNSFVFSNALNVLRRDPRVSDELNETAVGDYLAFGLNQDLATTTFRDIERLPAGHTLAVTNGAIKTRRYWTPAVKDEIRFRDPQSYVDRFSELFTTAINDRLRSDRVSISMSGGLDSPGIAVIAREQTAVEAFAVVYDELIPDEERHYSTLAASGIGIPIHHLSADKYELFAGEMNQPEPFLISPLGGQFDELMRSMASKSNVALTGYDGDALMNEPRRPYPLVGVRSFLRGCKRKEASGSYPEWIDDSFAKRTALEERWRKVWLEAPVVDKRRPATSRALQSKVWPPLLEGYHESSTRLPLEVRHPFIDVRLIDYLLSIPTKPWCMNKHILRCAMKDRLPAAVVNRPKTPLAGDPALQLWRRAGVRWLDNFEVTPQLMRFVNLKFRRSLAEEETPNALWARLRLFALNHWLKHSLPLDRRMVA